MAIFSEFKISFEWSFRDFHQNESIEILRRRIMAAIPQMTWSNIYFWIENDCIQISLTLVPIGLSNNKPALICIRETRQSSTWTTDGLTYWGTNESASVDNLLQFLEPHMISPDSYRAVEHMQLNCFSRCRQSTSNDVNQGWSSLSMYMSLDGDQYKWRHSCMTVRF